MLDIKGNGDEKCNTLQIPRWIDIVTPLQIEEWRVNLSSHPDKEFYAHIISGIVNGFRIGYDCQGHCRSAKSNMPSARKSPGVVDNYLKVEIEEGLVLGPITQSDSLHINRFGVIPKRHQTGKWRLIVDLSHPEGASINDGIPPERCSLKYPSVGDVVQIVHALGRGTQLAKWDIKNAYRMVPVHPADRKLLGMSWNGQTYVDMVLPFGLHSAPKIFTAVADALEYILQEQGIIHILHYLDEFVLLGRPGKADCEKGLHIAMEMCHRLGVPIAEHKMEGPTWVLTFLGIEVHSERMEVRLPEDKLHRIQEEIKLWTRRKFTTKRYLLSLIGQLQHACCVVRPGWTFLRRMIELSAGVKQLHYRVRLNKGFQLDLRWWAQFLVSWNGVDKQRLPIGPTMVGTISSVMERGRYNAAKKSSPTNYFNL